MVTDTKYDNNNQIHSGFDVRKTFNHSQMLCYVSLKILVIVTRYLASVTKYLMITIKYLVSVIKSI